MAEMTAPVTVETTLSEQSTVRQPGAANASSVGMNRSITGNTHLDAPPRGRLLRVFSLPSREASPEAFRHAAPPTQNLRVFSVPFREFLSANTQRDTAPIRPPIAYTRTSPVFSWPPRVDSFVEQHPVEIPHREASPEPQVAGRHTSVAPPQIRAQRDDTQSSFTSSVASTTSASGRDEDVTSSTLATSVEADLSDDSDWSDEEGAVFQWQDDDSDSDWFADDEDDVAMTIDQYVALYHPEVLQLGNAAFVEDGTGYLSDFRMERLRRLVQLRLQFGTEDEAQ